MSKLNSVILFHPSSVFFFISLFSPFNTSQLVRLEFANLGSRNEIYSDKNVYLMLCPIPGFLAEK
jgi:hypothetical protein